MTSTVNAKPDVSPPAVEMRGIVKKFPGVLANDHVDFELRAGEIHALLGENGAGKSTLMNVLAGLYKQDAGIIKVKGRTLEFSSPRDAIKAGIGMVHQHFMLVPSQTVAENILLGLDEPRFFMQLHLYEKKIADLGDQFGLKVDPRAKIWQLSVGEQQRVELLKMLYRGADVLIMDERPPSSRHRKLTYCSTPCVRWSRRASRLFLSAINCTRSRPLQTGSAC